MENNNFAISTLNIDTQEGQTNVVETFEKVYHSNGEVASSSFSVSTDQGVNRAFCIQFGKKAPAVGEFGENLTISDNDLLRKVFYYGYNGVEPQRNMDADFFVETATAASLSRGWDMKESAMLLASDFIEQLTDLTVPPEEFQVWTMETNQGETQELAYWTMSIKEEIRVSPTMESEAVDGKTGTHFGSLEYVTRIEDTVYLSNLTVGEMYTLTGYLVNRATQELVLVKGEWIESTVQFEAIATDMEIINVFEFDGTSLEDLEVVVFELLYDSEGVLIVSDTDVENDLQTVSYTVVEEEYVYIEENDEIPQELEEEILVQEDIEEGGEVSKPQTGDDNKIFKYCLLSILAGVGVFLANKNKAVYEL